jgi:hypothetical protein
MQSDHAFRYVECDVPEGVTLDRWRSTRGESRPRRRLVRLSSLRGLSYARAGSSRRKAPEDGV